MPSASLEIVNVCRTWSTLGVTNCECVMLLKNCGNTWIILTFLDNFYITQCTSVKAFSVDGIIRVFYYFYIYLVHFHAIVLSHSPFKCLMLINIFNIFDKQTLFFFFTECAFILRSLYKLFSLWAKRRYLHLLERLDTVLRLAPYTWWKFHYCRFCFHHQLLKHCCLIKWSFQHNWNDEQQRKKSCGATLRCLKDA